MRHLAGRSRTVPTITRPDGATIYFEIHGSGYPLLLIAPGGVSSQIAFWTGRSAVNPIRDFASDFTVIAMDQRHAGKRLLLITNSDWTYTRSMMAYALDRFLPDTMTWRDLFDIVIVDAAKPRFFSDRLPVHRVVDEDAGLMTRHHGPLAARKNVDAAMAGRVARRGR